MEAGRVGVQIVNTGLLRLHETVRQSVDRLEDQSFGSQESETVAAAIRSTVHREVATARQVLSDAFEMCIPEERAKSLGALETANTDATVADLEEMMRIGEIDVDTVDTTLPGARVPKHKNDVAGSGGWSFTDDELNGLLDKLEQDARANCEVKVIETAGGVQGRLHIEKGGTPFCPYTTFRFHKFPDVFDV